MSDRERPEQGLTGPSLVDVSYIQEMCDFLAKEFGHIVTVMGGDGVIIASSKHERVGTIHREAARVVAGECDEAVISLWDAMHSEHMRRGVNLGVDFEGKRIYSIGVAGPPKRVRSLVRVARHYLLTLLKAMSNERQRQDLEQQNREAKAESAMRAQILDEIRKEYDLSQQVIDSAREGVFVTNNRATIEWVNPAFERITGYDFDDVLGLKAGKIWSRVHGMKFYAQMWRTLDEKGFWEGEILQRHKDGHSLPVRMTITSMRNDEGVVERFAAIFSDISNELEAARQVDQLSFYDPLTKLPNRRLFLDRLNTALTNAKRDNYKVGLIIVDLDRFKRVNEVYGQALGDYVLKTLGERLRETFKDYPTLARTSGDGFALLVSNPSSVEDLSAIADRIHEAFRQPVNIRGQDCLITASVGIAVYPEDALGLEQLLAAAELAQSQAKEAGRNASHFYAPDMNEAAATRLALESDFLKAIDSEELFLEYQPQVDGYSGQVVGLEALVRWCHDVKGTISPADFIPKLERTPLMSTLSDWVLSKVCEDITLMQSMGLPEWDIAVNISPSQLSEGMRFVKRVETIIGTWGVDPKRLDFELTETTIMRHGPDDAKVFRRLKEMGIGLAIDDFGTGYSSLSYLTDLPIDTIKIDRTFVAQIPSRESASGIVDAVLAMASSLDLKVVAEGVETPEQAQHLRAAGCPVLQGFLYARPMLGPLLPKWYGQYQRQLEA